ncbi:MAG TPA: hypothetical protein VHX11_01200 [Acidobacteriaceae bacterium]|jgi:hypothetical protein|nr:hypothetical protein [Acidobacteriaceae bacterium]
MANVELGEDTTTRIESPATADLLVAIAAPVNVEQLRATASDTIRAMSPRSTNEVDPSISGLRAAVAFPADVAPPTHGSDGAVVLDPAGSGVEIRFIPLAESGVSAIPWLGTPATYEAIFQAARGLGVKACAVVASDLASFRPDLLQTLLAPVLEKGADLAMPVYPAGKLDGLLNASILSPVARALYGKKIRYPLALDFGISARLLQEIQPARRAAAQGSSLFWPVTEAVLRNRTICQTGLEVKHPVGDALDASTVLTQTVGPLFAEMESNASFWQRVRGSQTVEMVKALPAAATTNAASVDIRPMLETFQLGSRNLQEMWGLVLPPVTLLELKRLTRMPAEQFRMPDELWVRIIYDFALAYRLRTLSRSHLLGALTPLYLGWVASHVMEVSKMRDKEAEQRVERLARAYEDGKPYLLSRWRWPDRFNP